MIEKELNPSLSTYSQKGVDIEKRAHPRAQNIEEDTRFSNIVPYVRKKKGGKETRALREHTVAQLKALNFDVEPLHSSLDASQENVDMQLHSIPISLSPIHIYSLQISSNIIMIDNIAMSNSPSLKLMGEPTLKIHTHHSEKTDLLKCQSFL